MLLNGFAGHLLLLLQDILITSNITSKQLIHIYIICRVFVKCNIRIYEYLSSTMHVFRRYTELSPHLSSLRVFLAREKFQEQTSIHSHFREIMLSILNYKTIPVLARRKNYLRREKRTRMVGARQNITTKAPTTGGA